jgi:hypothetical protein
LRIWTSPAEAFKEAGTMKLSTRVGELRLEGYEIEDKWEGPARRFKLYRLKPKNVKEVKTMWVKVFGD